MSPARKREAVAHLERQLQVSQRRACKVINQPRSTHRYACTRPGRDAKLAAELRRYATAHPRRGYRMAAAQLRRQGMKVNGKEKENNAKKIMPGIMCAQNHVRHCQSATN